MLKIKKDNVELIVTSGAYDNLYKDMGYEVVEGQKVVEKVAPVKEAPSSEPQSTQEDIKPTFTKANAKKVEK